MPVAQIDGLFEAHLQVTNVTRAVSFYTNVLGLKLAKELPDQRVAFLWTGNPGHSMLGLWEAGSSPQRMALHVAFKVGLEELFAAISKLHDAGIEPRGFDGEKVAEPIVLAWMPAAAIYFRDPDGNLLEFIAILEALPMPQWGVLSWSEWTARKKARTAEPGKAIPADEVRIRPALVSDLNQLAVMCEALWPISSAEEHAKELRLLLDGRASLVVTLPITILVAEVDDERLAGFVEVDLRSHADGCDPSKPVGYIEGWYVAEEFRRRGVGKELMAAAEEWARNHHCDEIASDAVIDNLISQHTHETLGYEVVDRCVHYRKKL
jgi:GNAT superfamily N-acetyltransferase/catechol 2,3-dioxygenase-like lactoylglutathione lyase family enzyme